MNEVAGRAIHITGVVQGVGFRPFVYGLAQQYGLMGWVRNSSAGVDIAVDGDAAALTAFVHDLQHKLPPLARIDEFRVSHQPANGFTRFEIISSEPIAGAFQPISPDVSLCPDCLRELFDPVDRRYRYPFINCTNCGPRFTIIQDIPYDRPKTTMAEFDMCANCRAEYTNPRDRRFHAQPIACPVCGPEVWLVSSEQLATQHSALSPQSSALNTQSSIRAARQLLAEGKIVAIKGLGGFHLACDATNAAAVATLRERKLRVDKPFAIMVADENAAATHCVLSEEEREVLCGRERPIVLLQRRPDSPIAHQVAPSQAYLGVMLPYTPLHYLLLEPKAGFPAALVMTSGNLSEEPIAYHNEDALTRLSALADAFLLHNRDIHVRCDDSVVRILDSRLTIDDSAPNRQSKIVNRKSLIPLRRSRGYAPFPVKLPRPMPSVLATGGELKNSFCLTRDQYAFMSHHIGDLENYETLRSFEEGIEHFERLFRVRPEIIAYDKHPNYLATQYALERANREGLPAIGVQHHHAHIAACMAEHGLSGNRPVIGVSLDGTGYGDDGTIWGGEFLVADYAGFTRPYHLQPVRLPGGDKAVREPWRMALAYLKQANIPWDETLPPVAYALYGAWPVMDNASNPVMNGRAKKERTAPYERADLPTRNSKLETALNVVAHQLDTGLNAPLTSSMGRLFDAAAALIGIRQVVNYEAQAAIEMEALVQEGDAAAYSFTLDNGQISVVPLWQEMVAQWRQGVSAAALATHFHNTIVRMVATVCNQIRAETGLYEVALSGGVWQNMTLLKRAIPLLQRDGFTVYWHTVVPGNDGGIALGQAVIAAASL